MRYEGLTNSEIDYLTTPIGQLTRETLLLAISVKDKHCELIRERNKTFVPSFSAFKPYVVSDDLGVHGVLNHANGKRYDSKSQYYADLKASGHVIVENGMDKPREQRGDYNVHDALKSAAREHGFLN